MEPELSNVKAELAARLRQACKHLSDDQFALLVDDIMRVRGHFAHVDSDPRGREALRHPDLELPPER